MADPFSVSGLAFSLSGLAVANLTSPAQLYSSGVVAYTTISDVRDMGASFGRQYWLFKAQESRFLFWGMCHNACDSGGLHLDHLPEIIRDAVASTLAQIKTILEDNDSLAARYGLQRIGDIMPADVSLVRRETQRQQNMVTRLHRSSSMLRRLQWVVRDQGRFAQLTQQLTGLTNALYDILPVPGGPWVGDTITAHTFLDSLINREERNPIVVPPEPRPPPGDLQEVATATSAASNRDQVENSALLFQPIAPGFTIEIQHLEFLGQHKTENLRSWARPKGAVNSSQFSQSNFLEVEWRGYDMEGGQAARVDLQARVEALVRMLKAKPRSESFRVFECMGYFIDNISPRFGITFRLPLDYTPGRDPVPLSLLDVLTDYSKDIPYLGDRFRLAYLLTESLHALHSTFWLHKSICSRNILLFRKNTVPAIPHVLRRPVSLEDPYFTSFALSRPDGPAIDSSLTAPPRDIQSYRHMDVQGLHGRPVSRYRAIHDIYSLGIVLLEIGIWRPITMLFPRSTTPNFDFGEYLLERYVPKLGVSMGENYMHAVRKCLEGSFQGLSGFGPNEYGSMSYMNCVREGLLWEVVNVLRQCHV